jgi:hypothetical protein
VFLIAQIAPVVHRKNGLLGDDQAGEDDFSL